jgi:hypothetical protein
MKSEFCICRIVGNELPPRDAPDTKFNCLKYIVEKEEVPEATRVWIVNHIVNDEYRQRVMDLLKYEVWYEVPFEWSQFRKLPTERDRIAYAINVNGARNHGIEKCQPMARFTVILDQDCYFWTDEWIRVKENIREDQKTHDRQYYGLVSKRIHLDNMPETSETVNDEEPMPIFRDDATIRFDPYVPFGDNDKRRLLWELGYETCSKTHTFKITKGDMCKTVGCVMHMAFGDEHLETSLQARLAARKESVRRFLKVIEEKHTIRLI